MVVFFSTFSKRSIILLTLYSKSLNQSTDAVARHVSFSKITCIYSRLVYSS